jgi:hypothetical protein
MSGRIVRNLSRGQLISTRYQRPTWLWRQLDADRVAAPYHASDQDDAHDTALRMSLLCSSRPSTAAIRPG